MGCSSQWEAVQVVEVPGAANRDYSFAHNCRKTHCWIDNLVAAAVAVFAIRSSVERTRFEGSQSIAAVAMCPPE